MGRKLPCSELDGIGKEELVSVLMLDSGEEFVVVLELAEVLPMLDDCAVGTMGYRYEARFGECHSNIESTAEVVLVVRWQSCQEHSCG